MAQGVHRQQRCIASLITEVVLKLSACQFRTTLGLSSDKFRFLAVEDVVTHEGEGNTTKVRATAEAGNHRIRIFPSLCHLFLSLQTDDGLMQSHMVEHGAQCIFTIRRCCCQLYCLAHSRSQRTHVLRILCDDVLSCTSAHRRTALNGSTESTHDARAIRLLLHGNLHLIHSSLKSEHTCCIRQGCAPLAGTRFGGDIRRTLLLGIVALRQGTIDFVGTQWIRRFVLEVDMCRRTQGLLQCVGTHQRSATIILILLQHLFGNINKAVGGIQFLLTAFRREDMCQVLPTQRLTRTRMQWG